MAKEPAMTDGRHVPWREALLERLLAVCTGVGFAAVAFSLLVSHGRQQIAALWSFGLIALLGAALLRRGWPYALRAGLVVGTFAVGSLMAFAVVGFHGTAPLLGAGAVVAAALLFGRKQMWLVLGLLVAGVSAAGAAMVTHALPIPDPASVSLTAVRAWSRAGTVAFSIWVLIGFAVTFAVEHIEAAARAEHEALTALREETARRESAEQHRKDAERVAQQAQKLEVVGQLAAGVAHDFNNLLAVVQCWAELGAKPAADPARREEARASILAASSQGAALARQLLTIGRRSSRAVRDVRLDQAVDAALFVVRRVLPEDIELVVEHAGGAVVRADEMDVQQVALNFVVNARDAMPGGGRLRVTTGVRDVAVEEAAVGGALGVGKWAFLAVEDSGTGVDPALRERIFEPFFTTKPQGSGTGLGLATVLYIARENGGTIALDSRPSQGAKFTFHWPALAAESLTLPSVSPTRAAILAREASILVVEDDVAIRQLMKSILEEGGHRVLTAADGHRALQLIGGADKLDLLCTDGVLPGQSAPTVIAAFEAAHPKRPVLVVSGYVQEELTLRGIEEGRYRLLRKPFTVGDLSSAVGELLDR
jgi:signal transduction histidine kinase